MTLLEMRKKSGMTVSQMKKSALNQLIEEQKEFRLQRSTSVKIGAVTCIITEKHGNIRYNHTAYTFKLNGEKIATEKLRSIIG